jgi:hypothetical protein
MTNLSPAADAVLDAYNSGFDRPVAVHHKPRIAAALRAVADQVVPAENPPADFLDTHLAAEIDQRRSTRSQLLAIAAELESQ